VPECEETRLLTDESPFSGLDLTGKFAVVTGASRGIGAATAALLRARGATVVGVSRSPGGPDDLQADVGDEADCDRIGRVLADRFDRLHILVNNAGAGAFGLPIDVATSQDWDHYIAVNAKSAFLLSKALLPLLTAARGAAIVNVSSVHATATSAGVAPYAASKGAITALTRSMAIDLAPRLIRVSGVLPGATATEMMQEHIDVIGKSAEELGFRFGEGDFPRVSRPEETAEVIAFLASPAGSAIAGSSVLADGGQLSTLGF
jgi:NAD(P)-dependent dehydrogenase (short-subunit alcohol dehydrogenase family)